MNILFAYDHRITFYAIALFAIGLLLRYWIAKRRFNRRALTGLQQYPNYHSAMLTSFIERLAKIIGTILIIGGIILYLIK